MQQDVILSARNINKEFHKIDVDIPLLSQHYKIKKIFGSRSSAIIPFYLVSTNSKIIYFANSLLARKQLRGALSLLNHHEIADLKVQLCGTIAYILTNDGSFYTVQYDSNTAELLMELIFTEATFWTKPVEFCFCGCMILLKSEDKCLYAVQEYELEEKKCAAAHCRAVHQDADLFIGTLTTSSQEEEKCYVVSNGNVLSAVIGWPTKAQTVKRAAGGRKVVVTEHNPYQFTTLITEQQALVYGGVTQLGVDGKHLYVLTASGNILMTLEAKIYGAFFSASVTTAQSQIFQALLDCGNERIKGIRIGPYQLYCVTENENVYCKRGLVLSHQLVRQKFHLASDYHFEDLVLTGGFPVVWIKRQAREVLFKKLHQQLSDVTIVFA